MTPRRSLVALLLLAVVGAGALARQVVRDPFKAPGMAAPQRRGGRSYRGGFDGGMSSDPRRGVPDWEIDERFPKDVFTFVRVQYGGGGGYGRGYGRWGGAWSIDFPDSDLNFSYRLQQLTSLKVDPDPVALELSDERLFDYPFLYLIEPGHGDFYLSEPEVANLRRYLLNGGFLMVDDFWGDYEYRLFYDQIRRVFPDREPMELPLDHPVFHIVYRLDEKPQVPSINAAWAGRGQGITWERGYDTRTPHYQGIFDDEGRMMVIICHNTDLGDGWEREGEDPWYFTEFSEKKAYPLGINIVTYAMTH